MFLYSTLSSLLDRSMHFAVHLLVDLFIPTPILLLLEAFSHASITVRNCSLTFPPLSTARYSFMQLSEVGCHGNNENAIASKLQQRESEPGFSRLLYWVWHSTAELSLLTSTMSVVCVCVCVCVRACVCVCCAHVHLYARTHTNTRTHM